MNERPIIMSGDSVRAILAGKKTQTRRVVKPSNSEVLGHYVTARDAMWAGLDFDGRLAQPCNNHFSGGDHYEYLSVPWKHPDDAQWDEAWYRVRCRIEPGDRLWIRETWTPEPHAPETILYRANGEFLPNWVERNLRWRSPIHMPRWASRLTLEVTDVRVERVQEISEEDAIAEGCAPEPTWTSEPPPARDVFEALWDSLHAKDGNGWAANPRVWVVDFRRVS